MAIRIVLAEDQYFVREGIRRLLETQDEVELAAVCDDLMRDRVEALGGRLTARSEPGDGKRLSGSLPLGR